jgi:hypothetical protein
LNNVWRLGILPEAPAQGEHKVKEPRRDSREQVQAEQKAIATERTAPGQPRFSRSALGDIFARQLFNLAIAGSSVTEFAGALRPGSEGNSAGAATACHRCPPWILPKAAVFGCEMISAARNLI